MSEGIGALLAGWEDIVAIEMEEEYVKIGQARIDWWQKRIQEDESREPKVILKAATKSSAKEPSVKPSVKPSTHHVQTNLL